MSKRVWNYALIIVKTSFQEEDQKGKADDNTSRLIEDPEVKTVLAWKIRELTLKNLSSLKSIIKIDVIEAKRPLTHNTLSLPKRI